MKKFRIREPYWNGTKGQPSVGLNDIRITDDVEVVILYKNNKGERQYPDTYQMDKNKALSYPTKPCKNGVVLRIIPIGDFDTGGRYAKSICVSEQ